MSSGQLEMQNESMLWQWCRFVLIFTGRHIKNAGDFYACPLLQLLPVQYLRRNRFSDVSTNYFNNVQAIKFILLFKVISLLFFAHKKKNQFVLDSRHIVAANLHNHTCRSDCRRRDGRESTALFFQPGASTSEDPASSCGGPSLNSLLHRGHVSSHQGGRICG